MKKLGLLFICLMTCLACDNNNIPLDVDLIGEWRLFENYADPGDGSGTFRPIFSQKTITFHADGTITSNGSLCDITITTDNPTSGVYSLVDSTFTPQDCSFGNMTYQFQKERNVITIGYPCIEGCGSRYMKIQ